MTNYKNPFEDPEEKLWDKKIKDFKIPERKETPLEGRAEEIHGYIYVPTIKLYVAKEKSLYGLSWYRAHEELHKQGLQMLTIRQFIDFVLYLKENPSMPDAKKILDEILTRRKPYGAEWLDAYFGSEKKMEGLSIEDVTDDFEWDDKRSNYDTTPNKKSEKLYIHYNHRTIDSNSGQFGQFVSHELVAQNTEPLERCLMEDCGGDCGIDLKSCNRQGLPTKKGSSIEYYFPCAEDYAATFEAYSDGVGLNCVRNPLDSRPELGVRAAREK